MMSSNLHFHSTDSYGTICVELMLNSTLDLVCQILEEMLYILSFPMFS
jgi:hypothetical protein